MKKSTVFVYAASLLCAMTLVACGGNNKGESKNNNNSSAAIDVAGTYTNYYGKSEISGNIRHTGYLTASDATFERNRIILDGNGGYEYSKMVTTDPSERDDNANAQALRSRKADDEAFLAWTSVEGDGSTLVFNADGTFNCVAKAGSYSIPANGTWEWKNWTLKVKTEAGAEATGVMDGTTHALTIQIDCGHSVLRNFSAEATVWAGALGQTGNYEIPTPEPENKDFLAWTSVEGDGSTLVFNADGTFNCVAKAGSYSIPANGTWEWKNWTLKVKTEAGAEATGVMDGTTHALTIQIDCGHSVLRNFSAEAAVWAGALGQTGNYTPVANDAITYFYTGSGSKQGGGATYDATILAFFLKDNRAYIVEKTETNAQKKEGSWKEANGVITLTIDKETYTSGNDGFVILGIKTTLSNDIPSEYKSANWDELFEALNVKYSEYIKHYYVFKGQYEVTADGVTLKSPTSISWSEDWAHYQAYGFTNVSGNSLDDKVYPKGETGEFYFAVDHFNTNNFYMAPNSPEKVTGNVDINVILDQANHSFSYNNKSIFDD